MALDYFIYSGVCEIKNNKLFGVYAYGNEVNFRFGGRSLSRMLMLLRMNKFIRAARAVI